MAELHGALALCHDNELLAAEVQRLVWGTVGGDAATTALSHVVAVRELTQQRLDAVTAHLLQHADELQNAKGEVVICAQSPTGTTTQHPQCAAAKLGLWVNLAKNPRFKTIQIPQLGITAELPKPLALASIAVRCVSAAEKSFQRLWCNAVVVMTSPHLVAPVLCATSHTWQPSAAHTWLTGH